MLASDATTSGFDCPTCHGPLYWGMLTQRDDRTDKRTREIVYVCQACPRTWCVFDLTSL
jgi:hypothetical protein